MLYHLAAIMKDFFGPVRLLQSYTVLIALALYAGFGAAVLLLPKFYGILPSDRGREFTLHAEAAKGKPTGAGIIFISLFVIISFLIVPLDKLQVSILVLTWLTMLTGFLDDRSTKGWGEYVKALLDLAICLAASFFILYLHQNAPAAGSLAAGTSALIPAGGAPDVQFWLPFVAKPFIVAPWIFITVSTVILWASINTTNCTDGVDGLSGTLVLVALITMGVIFYFILGHKEISAYLLVPHLIDGASWALITFALAGVLMGYLWHNAFPSKVLMGDAGSRAIGFFIGVCVIVSGNPFLILATSSIIFINGGMGLLKVALLRFFKIKIFANIRFPLHDHMRKNRNWSPTQVLIKFLIMQVLITIAMLGVIFKIR